MTLVAMSCGFAGDSRAQETSARLLEVEALVGYTAVDVEQWGRVPRVDSQRQNSGGINARFFMLLIRNGRVGFELGTQHLFVYEVITQSGTSVTREKHTVAAQHASVIARFTRSPKLTFDAGAGFYYFAQTSLPGVLFAANYNLRQGKRVGVPVGVRVDFIVDNDVTAIPMSLKAGVSFTP